MKWIEYIFECIMSAFSSVGVTAGTHSYMYSVGREQNATDILIGAIGMLVIVAIFISCVLLGRYLWKKHHTKPAYNGLMKANKQDSVNAAKSETEEPQKTQYKE